MNQLLEICETKREDITCRKQAITRAELDAQAKAAGPVRGFAQALQAASRDGFALIAEVKKASPSKGLIRNDFNPPSIASAYQAGGAACLSVLTDVPYFQGSDEFLRQARAACTLPCLRKDFMVDPWQVPESRAIGADAILIILAALDDVMATEIEAEALEYGLDVLIEVHDETEMERALRMQSRLIGVNNRDLRTFETDLAVSERLAVMAPDDVMLASESGIAGHADLERLANKGIRAFLVGESLMRQDDVQAATRALLEGSE